METTAITFLQESRTFNSLSVLAQSNCSKYL